MQESTVHTALALIGSLAMATSLFAAAPVYQVKPWSEVSDHSLTALGKQVLEANRDQWKYAESLHFIGYAYSVRELDALLPLAEFAYDEINRYLAVRGGPPKTRLFLIQDAKLWSDLLSGAGFRPDGLAFHYQQDEIFLMQDANQDRRPDRVPHEIVHSRLGRVFGDVPLWLDEGLANFLGWRVAEAYARMHAVSLTQNLPAMDPGKVLGLDALTSVHAYPDDAAAAVYYREVEELIRAIDERITDERLPDLVGAICVHHANLREALKGTFGYSDENVAKLEKTVIERTTHERSL